jgi:tRNA nucleotidyltransferase/poly(A) polymerase
MSQQPLPTHIEPHVNLEQIREECLELVKKRAYFSAGAAIIPVPFFDVLVDVGLLSQLIPEVNARFGLAPEQVTLYDLETKQINWDELKKRGVEISGIVVTRTAAKKTVNNFAAKYITKQVTKFIPLGGQMIAAGLGFFLMKKVAEAHVEESYKLAKKAQQNSKANTVNPT